jgi:hypothetical protein
MPAETTAVTSGSAHCGGKCDGCAKTSPMNVAKALIVAWRATELVVRSICASRATLTAAPTIPQTEARRACSRLNAAAKSPRAITRKQASQAHTNFSAAVRTSPPARKPSNARMLDLKLGMSSSLLFCRTDLRHSADKGNEFAHHAGSIRGDIGLPSLFRSET